MIPGGDADLGDSGFRIVSQTAIEYSREQAKKGIMFPVLGICRGAQMIMELQSEEGILADTDSHNVTLPLTFTKDVHKSKLFGHAPKQMLQLLENEAITFNAHIYSVTTAKFYDTQQLKDNFFLISTNYDRKGIEFVSTFEGEPFIKKNYYIRNKTNRKARSRLLS